MLTLSEMQHVSVNELMKLSLDTDNKYYSCALTHMAHAQTEYLIAGKVVTSAMLLHVSKAKEAYALVANESVALSKIRATANLVKENGAALSPTVPGGKNVVKVGMSKLAIWDLSWGTR